MTAALCDPLVYAGAPLLHDLASVRTRIPQRFEMGLLHGIVHFDLGRRLAVGVHHSTPDDFWTRGHIPGRPLMPGVVMVEVAAQLCAWVASYTMPLEPGHFFGFAGIDRARFRGQVVPGDTLLVAVRVERQRRTLATFGAQAWVEDALVFEASITGVSI